MIYNILLFIILLYFIRDWKLIKKDMSQRVVYVDVVQRKKDVNRNIIICDVNRVKKYMYFVLLIEFFDFDKIIVILVLYVFCFFFIIYIFIVNYVVVVMSSYFIFGKRIFFVNVYIL